MKKWLLIIFSTAFILAAFSFSFYSKAINPKKQALEVAEKRMLAETDLTAIKQFYLYYGAESYFVVIGKKKNGEEAIAWIPEDEKKKVLVKKVSDGITKQEAMKKLEREKVPKEFLSVKLGLEKDLPVWELTYLDEKDQLNYYYIHFDTGKWWRKIENL